VASKDEKVLLNFDIIGFLRFFMLFCFCGNDSAQPAWL